MTNANDQFKVKWADGTTAIKDRFTLAATFGKFLSEDSKTGVVTYDSPNPGQSFKAYPIRGEE